MAADDPFPIPTAAAIVGLLAGDARRRVLAALVLGATTPDEVRRATGLTVREIATSLSRLTQAGLVLRGDDGANHVITEAFRLAAVAAAPPRSGADPTGDAPDGAAKILRSYFRAGRLVRVPRAGAKRLVVLDRLAQPDGGGGTTYIGLATGT